MNRINRFWYRINSFAARFTAPDVAQAGQPAEGLPGHTPDVHEHWEFHPFRTTLYRGPDPGDIGPIGLTQVQADWNERFPYDADGE